MSVGTPLFERAAIIGLGLIGSSLARAIRAEGLVAHLIACDASPAVRERVAELGLVDTIEADPAKAMAAADLVVIATPLSTYAELGAKGVPAMRPGAILTDVGSVKSSVLRDLQPHLPAGVVLVPGHPVAGTEHSGPDAGFAELFRGRWCILTPPAEAPPDAVRKVAALWEGVGMTIEIMDAAHHDKVLAITSHVPHLIAYTIVDTATDLEAHLQGEVIKFAAGGFRDFTRIAASDPVMWRDVFLNNREAVLEMLGRLSEDLAALQKAIRWGDGQQLQDVFTRARTVRRSIIEARQA